MTSKQKEASIRNWKKARMLSALNCIRFNGKWKHPETAKALAKISSELEAVIAKEWPEYWIQLRASYNWDIDDTLSRKDCLAVLKDAEIAWKPKSLFELRQVASYLRLLKHRKTNQCKE